MKTNPVILLVMLLTSLSASAQQSIIRGVVTDQQSEIPLIGATVQVVDSDPVKGGITDVNGAFIIKDVPVGRMALRVSYPGYETQTIPNLLLTAGKDLQLELSMRESFNTLNEVVVNGNSDKDKSINELATISTRQFNTEEVMRYSGGRNDVAKLVANFAGVAANNDARNDIIIRGNSPTGVLWRLEGIPIPNPNHFSTLGTTGGPVSALNPNLISNSDFMTGAFPAEYGNALAGVFDINLRSGNKDRHEYMFQLGAFSGLEALAEGPLNKKNNGSFVAAYRHSFVELASAAGLNVGTTATPRYKDFSFNADLGNTKAGRFSFFGIAAHSNIDFIGADIDTADLWAQPNQNAYSESMFGVAGLKHSLILNDNAYWRTILSGSFTGTRYSEEDLEINDGEPFQDLEVKDDLFALRLSSFYNHKFSSRGTLRAGVLIQQQQLNTLVQTRDGIPDFNKDGLPDWWVQRDYDDWFNQSELFVQGKYRLTESLTLNAGLHGLYFDHTNDFALEPRAAINWQVAPKHKINIGYGMHNQVQPLPVFLFQTQMPDGSSVLSNDNLGFTQNQHFVVGYDFKPASNWRIKTEAYYQLLSGIPVDTFSSSFSIINTGADFVFPERGGLVNEGEGFNRGVELTVEKFFSQGYYGLFSLSLFESQYKGSDDVWRSTAFDGGYVVNFLTGKEFQLDGSGRRFLTLDTKLTAAGGRPYTPVNLEASQLLGTEVLFEDQAFSQRLDPYFRWDAKIGFRQNSPKRKISQTFFLDFQNLTNNENVFAMRYNEERGAVGRINQIGFFPDVLYRLEF